MMLGVNAMTTMEVLNEMGMTNEQFRAYQRQQLRLLKFALKLSPDNEVLIQMIEDLEAELRLS